MRPVPKMTHVMRGKCVNDVRVMRTGDITIRTWRDVDPKAVASWLEPLGCEGLALLDKCIWVGLREGRAIKTPVQDAIVNLRKRLCLTQAAFALRIGVTAVTVCRWETSRPPTGTSLALLEQFAARWGQPGIAAVFRQARENESLMRPLVRKVMPMLQEWLRRE